MIKYISLFRMKFIAGLQYRSAAAAGIVTQFFFGFMEILLFKVFYEADTNVFPMSFEALVSYIWLQQALLTLFLTWAMDNDIFRSISDGSITYELCRPVQIYHMWFSRSMATRLSKMVLRSMPISLVAVLLPQPYRMVIPADAITVFWFIISLCLGFLLVVAFGMIIYIITFYTLSSYGVRIVIIGMVEFLSGSIVPLPFFPDKIRWIIELLPFASMQNIPLRIYSGDIAGIGIFERVGLQVFWFAAIYLMGYYLMKKALQHVVVQGG